MICCEFLGSLEGGCPRRTGCSGWRGLEAGREGGTRIARSTSSSLLLKSIGLFEEPAVGAGRRKSSPSPTRLVLCARLISLEGWLREGPTEGPEEVQEEVDIEEVLRRLRFAGRSLVSLMLGRCIVSLATDKERMLFSKNVWWGIFVHLCACEIHEVRGHGPADRGAWQAATGLMQEPGRMRVSPRGLPNSV